ncbi:sigma-70 family RNA polymerase sigma factor [Acinetobacter larvae]|nr:sigma-70 family RNA polymerase sigma factor [Acinetobacter larvae]
MAHYVAELYKNHKGWLYGWLYQKLGSVDTAEDVLHDTFLRIIRSQELFQIQQPKAFLTTTAKRILIDRARRAKIEQAYLDYLTQAALSYEISPEQVVMAIDSLDRLAYALEDLSYRMKMAFLWHYIDDLSLKEIAARLGVSSKTIHHDLVYALTHCYKVLH